MEAHRLNPSKNMTQSLPLTEADIFNGFLSTDPIAVAEAAARLGPFWVALAGAPIKSRQSAAEAWRADRVREIVSETSWLATATGLLPKDQQDELAKGKISIATFLDAAREAFDNHTADRRAKRAARKAALHGHLTALHATPERTRQSGIPSAALLTEAGALSWHRSRSEAKTAGLASGGYFVVMPIDAKSARFFRPGDAAAAVAPFLG